MKITKKDFTTTSGHIRIKVRRAFPFMLNIIMRTKTLSSKWWSNLNWYSNVDLQTCVSHGFYKSSLVNLAQCFIIFYLYFFPFTSVDIFFFVATVVLPTFEELKLWQSSAFKLENSMLGNRLYRLVVSFTVVSLSVSDLISFRLNPPAENGLLKSGMC